MKRISMFGIVLLALALSITSRSASAQTKNCECRFDTKDYEAYGTNGACGIFMYNKAHSCEVSFSGTGANAKLLVSRLGAGAWDNQLKTSQEIFQRYIAYVKEGDRRPYDDSRFIERSIVVLARGTLFRESSMRGDPSALEKIDTMFQDFSKGYSERVAATFSGKAKPFTVRWQEGARWLEGVKSQEGDVFSVGEGYIELNFRNVATVRVVYFSDHNR